MEDDLIFGAVYSWTVYNLVDHPEMIRNKKTWSLYWDKDTMMLSEPPHIGIVIDPKYAEEFKALAERVCPGCWFTGFIVSF